MTDGEVVEGGIVDQSRLAIQNCVDITQLKRATALKT